ncbi:MAG: hypothetical protein DLM59_18030 [Pseudonocardiales bacterium]|nr:MAG: hypothetical protein DLM59_18030 [Pseudonocardiales bacterium]
MSQAPPPEPREGRPRLSAERKAILVLGLLLVVALCLSGGVFLAVSVRVVDPVIVSYDLAAGTDLTIDVLHADFALRASTDGRIHVSARGSYAGRPPTLHASTSGSVTTVGGQGCENRRPRHCSFKVTVALPPALPLTMHVREGNISATGLTGPLELGATNGDITASGAHGRLDLRTTNGHILVLGATSQHVNAATTNGDVELVFLRPPTTVSATSTNGNVTVRVPARSVTYLVSTRTLNGLSDISLPSDRTSTRTLTAQTTNGIVTIAPA